MSMHGMSTPHLRVTKTSYCLLSIGIILWCDTTYAEAPFIRHETAKYLSPLSISHNIDKGPSRRAPRLADIAAAFSNIDNTMLQRAENHFSEAAAPHYLKTEQMLPKWLWDIAV